MKLIEIKDYIKQLMKDNIDEAKHHQYPNSVFYTAENDGLKKALDKIEEYEKTKQTITNVEYETSDIEGCETCNWGGRYIRDMYITYDNNIEIHFHTDVKYEDDGISESDWMKGVLNTTTSDELIQWYIEKTVPIVKDKWKWEYVRNKDKSCEIYYEVKDLSGEGVSIKKHYIGVDDE